jgi:hypothetical protein
MNGRKAVIGLSLLCALAFAAFAAPSAQAGTTAFTCAEDPNGTFTEAHCAANGHSDGAKYKHVGFEGTTVWKSTNHKTKNTTLEDTPAILKGTLAGAASELTCTTVKGSGSLTNETVSEKMKVKGTAAVEYTECKVVKPTKGCIVEEPIIAEATVASIEAGETMGLEFKGAKAGGVFAEIKYLNKGAEKCALLNGGKPFPVTGSTVATDKGATSEFTAAHSKLVLGGNAASYTGVETVSSAAGGTPLSMTTTSP